jgi:hypothetical protein
VVCVFEESAIVEVGTVVQRVSEKNVPPTVLDMVFV